MKSIFGTCLLAAVWACGESLPPTAQNISAITYTYTPPPCVPGSWSCGFREAVTTHLDACPTDVWIGYELTTHVTACPAPARSLTGSWAVTKLFSATTTGLLPAPLQRFCQYSWSSATGAAPDIAALPNIAGLRLERDCRVAAPMLVPGQDAASRLIQSYTKQIDRPLFTPALPPPATKVRIAVIDTSAEEVENGQPSSSNDNQHGVMMATLARNNACYHKNNNTQTCPVFIANHAGLPLDGGYGRVTHVATAIVRAVDEWLVAGTEPNAVMNLSIGWDNRFGGLHGPLMRISALSAWHATQLARCHGMLIFAAAGNRSTGDEDQEPVLPAGWEAETMLNCSINDGYAPLVHGVGGVDRRDRTIAIARRNANPRLVAPAALHAAQLIDPETAMPTEMSPILTGTSISSAGVAGIAAMVWARNPTYSAAMVANQLYMTATALGSPADFGLGGAQTQKRINACAAITAGCIGPECPNACLNRPAFTAASLNTASVLESEFPGITTLPISEGTFTPGPQNLTGSPATIFPFVGPQPDNPLCPLCMRHNNYLQGRLELPEGPESLVKLVLSDDTGVNEVLLELDDPLAEFNILLDDLGLDAAEGLILSGQIALPGGKQVIRASEIPLD